MSTVKDIIDILPNRWRFCLCFGMWMNILHSWQWMHEHVFGSEKEHHLAALLHKHFWSILPTTQAPNLFRNKLHINSFDEFRYILFLKLKSSFVEFSFKLIELQIKKSNNFVSKRKRWFNLMFKNRWYWGLPLDLDHMLYRIFFFLCEY